MGSARVPIVRVLIVTGIFPPDIGGPATHTSDLADALRMRGHAVHVLTLTDAPDAEERAGLTRWPRAWPWPRRALALVRWMRTHRHEFDVVYANSMTALAVPAARVAGLPVVAKVVGDHAWERGVRTGLTAMSFDEFQQARQRGRLRWMQRARNAALRRASAVTAPSEMMRPLVERWAGGRAVTVVPNGVAVPESLPAVDAVEAKLRLVYVGRLVSFKRVDLILRAVAATPDVALDVLGDGPERSALEALAAECGARERVRFLGAVTHDDVLARIGDADALVLASEYEMLPHTVIEALVMGTPVVAPPIGGMRETVADGESAVLLDPCTAESLAEAFAHLRNDAGLRAHLRDGAARAGGTWRFDRCVVAVEEVLRRAVGPTAPPKRPRAVFVGRSQIAFDDPAFCRKLAFIAAAFDATILGSGTPSGRRDVAGVRTVAFGRFGGGPLGSVLFHTVAPLTAVLATVRARASVIVTQSPHGAALPILLTRLVPRRVRPAIVVEAHGDWRASARLYGGRARHALAALADRTAEYSLRRADRIRVVSRALERQVRATGSTAGIVRYTTFGDFARFRDAPLTARPERPVAVFAGGLDPVKAVDVLLAAWVEVRAQVPDALLVVAGDGPERAALEAQARAAGIADQVAFLGRVDREELRRRIDAATCLVLPSRSEGLPRIILEAMVRARPVVATTVGGIPELVDDGVTGWLVAPDDPDDLAARLIAVLADPGLADAASRAARDSALARDPEVEFETGTAALARWVATTGWR